MILYKTFKSFLFINIVFFRYDIIIDATDNIATRYLLSDAGVLAGKPVVSGSALRNDGQLTVYNYKNSPCFRCLHPVPPPASTVGKCVDNGVLGVGKVSFFRLDRRLVISSNCY